MTARLPDTSIWGGYAGMNPRDPFDPSQPDYPGRPDLAMPYQSSLEDRVLALALGMGALAMPGATVPLPRPRPRLPDESSANYAMRTSEASGARPIEHQWMLGDPRIGQNQVAPDLNGDPEAPATFDERWVLEQPGVEHQQIDANLLGRPVGRNNVPSASNRTELSGTPLPRPKPRYMVDGYSPETFAELQTLAPLAAEMWIENAAALKTQGIQIQIKQGRRTEGQNKEVRGAKNSQHLQGTAIDISLRGLTTEQKQAVVSQFLSDPRVNGFGYYPEKGSIHVDVRNSRRKAWGSDFTKATFGVGWPQWLTDQVREWWPDAPIRILIQKRKSQ